MRRLRGLGRPRAEGPALRVLGYVVSRELVGDLDGYVCDSRRGVSPDHVDDDLVRWTLRCRNALVFSESELHEAAALALQVRGRVARLSARTESRPRSDADFWVEWDWAP